MVGRVIKTILGTGNFVLPQVGRKTKIAREKMIVGVEWKEKEREGEKKRQSRCGMSLRVVFWPSYPVISTTLSDKIVGGSGEASSLTATKIISRKRSGGRKGPRAFVNLAGGGNAGVTRRDSSRASFREIFHSTPRRPCYTAVSRDKR